MISLNVFYFLNTEIPGDKRYQKIIAEKGKLINIYPIVCLCQGKSIVTLSYDPSKDWFSFVEEYKIDAWCYFFQLFEPIKKPTIELCCGTCDSCQIKKESPGKLYLWCKKDKERTKNDFVCRKWVSTKDTKDIIDSYFRQLTSNKG